MAGKTRVPGDNALFNNYLNTTGSYIATGTPTTNGVRLGLTTTNVTDWVAGVTNWHDNIYPKYVNADTRTKTVVKQVQNFKKEFKTFANPLLNIMAASPNATEADEEVFNFITKRKKPTIPTTPISEQCYCTARVIGGGEIKFGFRTATDTKRPSLAEGADCVQIAYVLFDFGAGAAEPTPAPTPDTKGMVKEFHTKSQFMLSLGVENIGRRLLLFSRWYNTKHPELAGPWSPITVVLIG
jgi:hypothetical protein